MTATPLQRPRDLGDKSHFTKAEAAEYARTWLARLVQEEDDEDRTGADLNEIYLDDRVVVPDLRTSLLVDPPTGRLPPLVKAAQDRLDARRRENYDDPEARPLGERCILGLDGGSALTPPIVPNSYSGDFYQIVQTPTYVMVFTEQIPDARIIRIGGAHLPETCSSGSAIRSADGRVTPSWWTRPTSIRRAPSEEPPGASTSSNASAVPDRRR